MSAWISQDGKYRYQLERWWAHGQKVLFVMLNPSTADADNDDATIRSCTRLAKVHGYGSMIVANLFAWRATDPDELAKAADPIGPDNDRATYEAASVSHAAIFAWGAHPFAEKRAKMMPDLIKPGLEPMCFGVTKSGAPKHPLYIKSGTPLVPYPVRVGA